MKYLITAGMMAMVSLMAMGCQKSISEETEGAEVTGSDPDNEPVYPRDVHGTVTGISAVTPMYDLSLYLYDADNELIDTLYFFYGFQGGQYEQYYEFCTKGINAYGHPYPWHVCAQAHPTARPYDIFYACSDPISSRSFTEENCDPERPSAHRDILIGEPGDCEPNPCGD